MLQNKYFIYVLIGILLILCIMAVRAYIKLNCKDKKEKPNNNIFEKEISDLNDTKKLSYFVIEEDIIFSSSKTIL